MKPIQNLLCMGLVLSLAGCQKPDPQADGAAAPPSPPTPNHVKVQTPVPPKKTNTQDPASATPTAAYQSHLKAIRSIPLEPGAGVHAYQLVYVPRDSEMRYVVRIWKDAEGVHYESLSPGKGRGVWPKPKWIDFLRAIRSSGYWEAPETKASKRPGSSAWIEGVEDARHHLVHRVRPTGEFGRAVQLLFMSAAPKHGAAPVLQKK